MLRKDYGFFLSENRMVRSLYLRETASERERERERESQRARESERERERDSERQK